MAFRKGDRVPETIGTTEFGGEIPMRKGRPYDPAWDAWRPARRWPGVLLSAFAVAVFVGAIAYHYSAHSGVKIPSYNPPAVDRVQPPYAFPVALNSSAAQTYQGKMTESNLTFVATGRLMVWDMRCKKCNANFGVLVHNSTGATVDIPANAIGESQSTVPAAYAKGTYHVTVIADAPWTVSLIDPTALATLAAPFNYFTYGTGVLGPFSGNDSSLLMGYIGTLGSAATVTVYDESLKSAPQKLIYSSASFYKSLTIPSPPARYYLVITTTGLWNLKVDG